MWFWDIAGNVIGFIVIAGLALLVLFWLLGKLRSVITMAIRPFDLPAFLAIAMMTVFLWKTIDAFSTPLKHEPGVNLPSKSALRTEPTNPEPTNPNEVIWERNANGNLVRVKAFSTPLQSIHKQELNLPSKSASRTEPTNPNEEIWERDANGNIVRVK